MKQLLIITTYLFVSNLLLSQCDNSQFNLPTIDNYYRDVPIQPGGLAWEETFFLEGTQKDYYSTFANGLWVAGVDPGGNLKINIRTYRPFNPGPLNGTGTPFQNSCNYFSRLWVISGSDIELHKNNYEQGNIDTENTPIDILEWPAIGNIHFNIGEENGNILNQQLAPFFDTNQDGIYNALDGDIPIYKSGIEFDTFEEVWAPYIFSLSIVNDGNSAGLYNNADRLNMEILQSTYLLNCPNNQELNYTVFYSLNAVYKGEEVLDGVKFAFWEDTDFGCFTNDLLGCQPSLNTAYVYNAEAVESPCSGNVEHIALGWGMAKNTILLSHDMSTYSYYNNENVGNPNPNTTDPVIGNQIYSMMCGSWGDGSPITVGGSGYNPGSTESTLFVFPDLPNDPSGWNMVSTDVGNGDRRTLMGISAPDILSPNDNVIIDVASQVMFDPFTSHLGIFDNLEQNIEAVNEAYNTMQTNPQDLNECAASTCTDDCVWPGNIFPDSRVDVIDILYMGAIAGKGWDSGNSRNRRGSNWVPYEASYWNEELAGINIKHADCNGDGELTESDIEIFRNNFGFTIPNSDEIQNEIEAFDPDGFRIEFDEPTIDLAGSTIGRFVDFSIRPKEEGESFDFGYHGVSFDIVFDSSLIVPSALSFQFNEEYFSETLFADAFYDEEQDLGSSFELIGDNRISVAVSSDSGQNEFPNNFIIPSYSMIALENGTTTNLNGIDTTELRLENIVFMDADGNILDQEIGYYSSQLTISGLEVVEEETTATEEAELDLSLKISPNPTSGEITIQSQSNISGELSIINLDGNVVDRFLYNTSNKRQFDLSHYLPGVYVIQLKNAKGQLVGLEKLIVVE